MSTVSDEDVKGVNELKIIDCSSESMKELKIIDCSVERMSDNQTNFKAVKELNELNELLVEVFKNRRRKLLGKKILNDIKITNITTSINSTVCLIQKILELFSVPMNLQSLEDDEIFRNFSTSEKEQLYIALKRQKEKLEKYNKKQNLLQKELNKLDELCGKQSDNQTNFGAFTELCEKICKENKKQELLPEELDEQAKLYESFAKQYNDQTNFKAVKEFCRLFEQPTPDTVQKNIIIEKPELVNFRLKLIDEEVRELKEAVAENNMTEVIDALGDILYVVYGMGVALGIDLDSAFKIVHESNMTKFCKTEQDAIDTVEHYKTLPDFANVKVNYRLSKDGKCYIIYNEETSKILKSKYFTTPDFSKMLE